MLEFFAAELWYQCMYQFGTLYFNFNEEEIQERLNSGEDFYNLNNREVKNEI